MTRRGFYYFVRSQNRFPHFNFCHLSLDVSFFTICGGCCIFQSVVTFEISLCVIALSLSCEAAALASGLFIVIANLTVTANGESWFWFGVFRRFVWTKAAWRPDEVIKASHAKCFYRTGQSASKGLVSRNLWVVFKRRLRAKSTRRTTNTISSAHSHTSFQYKHTMKTPQERESKQDRQRERDPVRFP